MSIEEFLEEWNNPSPYVHVKTSGSTGAPKPMLVEKRRMLASARITCDFLGLRPGDTALLCMSLDYIAGKMMVVRSLERGLKLTTVEPSGHPLSTSNLPPSTFHIPHFTAIGAPDMVGEVFHFGCQTIVDGASSNDEVPDLLQSLTLLGHLKGVVDLQGDHGSEVWNVECGRWKVGGG